MAQIHEAIQAILSEIPAIGKTKKNQQQGFQYRGIDDVMNALNPLLSKHGVFCAPEVLDRYREERETKSGGVLAFTTLTVKYTFYAKDGSSISAVVVGEGMDSGDKSTNKALAVAMKYAMFQVFCIPTEEMKDPDSETPPELAAKSEDPPVQPAQSNKRQGEVKRLMAQYHIDKEQCDVAVSALKTQGLVTGKKMADMSESEFSVFLLQLEKRFKSAA